MSTASAAVQPGRIAVRAPAKVNLGLRVVGRRDDGYHLLESVFVPVDLSDDLEIALAPADVSSVRLRVDVAQGSPGSRTGPVPEDASNLAHRAASAFLEAAGLRARVDVALTKRTPAAAGLGGGSSDAGAVLRGLAELAPGALDPTALAAVALGLGADVPFFLDPRPALVTGIGERIEPLGALPPLHIVLANPGLALSTADVFRAWDALDRALTEPPAGSTLRALSALVASDPSDPTARAAALGPLLENDLEPVAARLCPPVRRLQSVLSDAGALATGMSGSGATVFGVFAGPGEAAACCETAAPGAASWLQVAVTEGAR